MGRDARQGTAWPRTCVSSPEPGRALPQRPCTCGSLAQKAPSSSCHSAPAPSSGNSLSSGELRTPSLNTATAGPPGPAAGPCTHTCGPHPAGTLSCLTPHPHTQPAEHYQDASSQYGCVQGMHDLLKTNQETTQEKQAIRHHTDGLSTRQSHFKRLSLKINCTPDWSKRGPEPLSCIQPLHKHTSSLPSQGVFSYLVKCRTLCSKTSYAF